MGVGMVVLVCCSRWIDRTFCGRSESVEAKWSRWSIGVTLVVIMDR